MSPAALAAAAAAGLGVAVLAARPHVAVRIGSLRRDPARGQDARTPLLGAVTVAALLAAGAAGPGVLGLAVVAVGLVGAVTLARRREERRDAARDGVVGLAEALVVELRAGRAPDLALASAAADAGPLAADVTRAATAARLGGDPAAALLAASARPGAAGLAAVAACWSVGRATGAGLAVALESVVESLDDDDRVRRELEAALAGTRATARVLVALPAVGVVLGSALGAAPLHVLTATPLGRLLAAGAVLLDAVGWWWMRVLVRRAER